MPSTKCEWPAASWADPHRRLPADNLGLSSLLSVPVAHSCFKPQLSRRSLGFWGVGEGLSSTCDSIDQTLSECDDDAISFSGQLPILFSADNFDVKAGSALCETAYRVKHHMKLHRVKRHFIVSWHLKRRVCLL